MPTVDKMRGTGFACKAVCVAKWAQCVIGQVCKTVSGGRNNQGKAHKWFALFRSKQGKAHKWFALFRSLQVDPQMLVASLALGSRFRVR